MNTPRRPQSTRRKLPIGAAHWLSIALTASAVACGSPAADDMDPVGEVGSVKEELGLPALPNNFPFLNSGGIDGTYSTDGYVDLTSEFATPQGTNGRDCTTCHAPQDGWGLTPKTAKLLFNLTDGLHPLFNIVDADRRTESDVSTVEARRESFSMLLQAKFVRNRALPSGAEYECIAFDDPFNFGSCERIHNFRTALPTANFRSATVSWDGGNNQPTLAEGLARQARSNVTGAQQGDPAPEEVIQEIVAFELNLAHAQMWVPGAGLLNAHGANGGPTALADQELVAGPFDLFDAWHGSSNAKRAQIARGQDLFNNGDQNGRRCGGCHNAANDGENVNGTMFDVGASDPAVAKSDMAVYTFRNLETGEVRASTDIGRALRTGLWSDMDRFKTPTLRGIAARPPYFHNGISETLHDVVKHYEDALGFDFSDEEEDDLVAFLNAL